MAVKRTSGVSPIISSIDRRVKAVESGQTALSAQYANAVTVSLPDDDDPNLDGPDTTSGVDKKYEYKRVLKAYIYGDKVTGAGSRCELYFGESPEILPDDPVDVQGVHGTSTDNFNISPKQFKVLATDTPPWTDADYRGEDSDGQLRQSWRNTPTTGNNGDTITNTVWFNPVVEVPSTYPRTSGRELITTRRIDTVDIDGSTVTVNLNSTHKFELGDIISVDLPQPAFGVDGVFRISDVPDTSTIVYELDVPLASPITLTSDDFTGGEAYIYPVARRYVKDGTVWVDKSVEPNKVWVWNVLRWYDTAEPIGEVSAVKDGIAPSPVTDLEATSTTTPGVGGKGATAEIEVTWTPPTTRSNGDPIDNYLGYYLVEYKRSTETNWTGRLEVPGSATSATIRDPFIRLLTTYNIRVTVYDIMEQPSDPTSTNVTTTNFSEVLNAPSTPTLETRLGTITVFWDGLDSTGNSPVQGVEFVEVHYSTTNNFTPDSSTLYTTFPITLQGNYAVVSNLEYNTDYYFKLRFVRSDGYTNETSAASAQATAEVAPLVDTDLINSTLNTWPFNGGVVPAGALADGSLNASSLFGPNVITQNAISANAIGAEQIAAGAIVAGKIGAGAITASEIAANTISAGMIKSNAIEADKIAAGAITASIIGSKEIELKATPTATQRIVLNSSGISAYNGTDRTFFINGVEGNINAASITVSNIDANNITVGTLSGDRIEANTITADKLSATLTVSNLIRTNVPDNDRIEIRGSNITNPGIVHVIGGVGAGNFRFYTNGFSYLNNLQLANANLTGSLNVSGTISGGTISGSTVSGGTISGANISGGNVSGSNVVGSTIRTVPAGDTSKRIILNTSGEIVFFNSNTSVESGRIEATANGLTMTTNGSTQISFEPNGSQTAFVSTSGMGFNGIDKRWIGSLIATGGLQAGNGNVVLSSNGNISAAAISGSSLTSSGGLTVTSGGASVTGGISATSLIETSANIRTGNRFRQDVAWDGFTGTTTAVHRRTSDGFFGPSGSDIRLKENVENLDQGLDFINNLRPVKYTYKSEAESPIVNYGLIAQEVRPFVDANTNIVNGEETETNFLSIEYIQFISPLIKAVQELSAKNDALEARLAALEGNG